MKFRVHTYQVFRVVYEVEAESTDDAYRLVDAEGWEMNPVQIVHAEEWLPDMIVDPLLENGDVDYEETRCYTKPPELNSPES